MSDKWKIVVDSACDLTEADAAKLKIAYEKVPFVLLVGKKEYVDNGSIDIPELLDAMEKEKEASKSACAGPGAWAEAFEDADNIIAVTISSELSGSYNSAITAKQMVQEDDSEKKICVVDSKSTGPAMVMTVFMAAMYINRGLSFEEISGLLPKAVEHTHTVFALCSFNNLIKNGRMGKIAGFIAGALGFWGTGIAKGGKIVVKGKSRGLNKAIVSILADFKDNDFESGRVFISHCSNNDVAEKLRQSILAEYPESKIKVMETCGLDSFYAERGGLIVAYMKHTANEE
jgi:DegV family protein with EDD domain